MQQQGVQEGVKQRPFTRRFLWLCLRIQHVKPACMHTWTLCLTLNVSCLKVWDFRMNLLFADVPQAPQLKRGQWPCPTCMVVNSMFHTVRSITHAQPLKDFQGLTGHTLTLRHATTTVDIRHLPFGNRKCMMRRLQTDILLMVC